MLKRRKSEVKTPKCPLGKCMEVLGGVWTPQIIWYLSKTPRRFSELKSDLAEISAKVLTERLKRLEKQDIVKRTAIDSSPPSVEYSLTKKGELLVPVVEQISKTGAKLKQLKDIQK